LIAVGSLIARNEPTSQTPTLAIERTRLRRGPNTTSEAEIPASLQFKTGNAGRFDTGFPAAFFSQYPRPGRGILSFRQTFASATSETLYRFATLIIGSAQISS
jgi:hypothetical protein